MTELIAGAIATGVGALGCGIALGRMLLRYREGDGVESPSVDSPSISLSRYAVLTRLTSVDDEEFLRKLPGFKPEMAVQMRRERRKILRLYLRELSADFHTLLAAARRMVADAPEEHADLVGWLMRQQITFWRCLSMIELRLALAPVGLPNVDAGRLLAVVEALRAAVETPGESAALA